MTAGQTGVKFKTGGRMGSGRETPSCGLFSLDVFCRLLWLWIIIGVGIGSAVWWLAGGQEGFDCKTADMWDPAHRLHFGGLFLDESLCIPQISGHHWHRSCCVGEWLSVHEWLTRGNDSCLSELFYQAVS